jgi:hypothetical protein
MAQRSEDQQVVGYFEGESASAKACQAAGELRSEGIKAALPRAAK